ncbi:MAG: 2-polyprenylphenol 6-hydroxylase [Legionellales bacterium]|nr:2-polyprenylphenol 6-hydroxylase [Legionellales bacterium]
MITPPQFFRATRIIITLLGYTLTRQLLGSQSKSLRALSTLNIFKWFVKSEPRGVAFRKALEKLGPIFVKFGQMLSVRSDFFPDDIILELEKLQDQVPPFKSKAVHAAIKNTYNKNADEVFASFNETPMASASVAQVHAATLPDGSDVIVKILRPNIKKTLKKDLKLMLFVARMIEIFWPSSQRLHLIGLVKEFDYTIFNELDLMREAASAAQLKRNFKDSKKLYVPKIYWDYTHTDILVMERIYGVRISDMDTLEKKQVNFKKLAQYGVEIFFTQVFRDSFFHADMHPGNLFIDIDDPDNPMYMGVDFGIMGSLNAEDKLYLGENLLAFFKHDYYRVAELHIQSGWVPPTTRVDQLEAAIRTVCEPIFDRPLSEISFANLLLRLFQTAKQFKMEVQPQLMLLQKTLIGIESLGRKLYPELDLWETALPILEQWIKEQHGLKKVMQVGTEEWGPLLEKAIRVPGMAFDVLDAFEKNQRFRKHYAKKTFKETKHGLVMYAGILTTVIGLISAVEPNLSFIPWIVTAIGIGLWVNSMLMRLD